MVNIFWFRRDLRIDDNHGLYRALSGDAPVLPLFIFDSSILDKLEDEDDARVEFIHHEVMEIKKALEALGSSLVTRYGTPEQVFGELIVEYRIGKVYANMDHEPYGRKRDGEIKVFLGKNGIGFETFADHTIFVPGTVLKDNGKPYTVFTPFKNKLLPLISEGTTQSYPSEDLPGKLHSTAALPAVSLSSTGFRQAGRSFPPKEFPVEIIENYDRQRNFPAIKGTSRLGVHLRFGTISLRKLLKTAISLNATYVNELVWREFFINILWHFPYVVTGSFKPKYDNIPWRNDEKEFNAWCEGKTGYPLVDAGMRELNATGFMHNRVRMVTASFLTKHLLIDWRWGEAYFARKLLDYELSSNNGGWQWAAGSGCDAAPYFRIFNPGSQAVKFDPENRYIDRWAPEYKAEQKHRAIVSHEYARERALSTFKKALS